MTDYTELINKLRYESTWRDDYPEDKDMLLQAADAIEQLEATVPKWIPVTERLPEDNVAVLVTYTGYDSHKPRVDMPAYRYEGTWLWVEDVTSDGPYGDVECAVPITHWMSLPEPPKEKTE